MKEKALELVVAAVAQNRIGAMLAAAKVNGLGFSGLVFHGSEAASLVAAVAEGLGGAFAAGTPVVALAGLDRNGVGSFLGNGRFGHGGISLKCSRHIIADPGEERFDSRKSESHRGKRVVLKGASLPRIPIANSLRS
jgi:hypothetical protein